MAESETPDSTQITVAGFGVVAVLVAAATLWLLGGTGPSADGPGAGFAVVVAVLVGWLGLLAVGTGLLIPPGSRRGVSFTRGQRRCFRVSVLGTLGVVAVPLGAIATGVASSRAILFGTAGSLALAVGGLAAGVGWRVVAAVRGR